MIRAKASRRAGLLSPGAESPVFIGDWMARKQILPSHAALRRAGRHRANARSISAGVSAKGLAPTARAFWVSRCRTSSASRGLSIRGAGGSRLSHNSLCLRFELVSPSNARCRIVIVHGTGDLVCFASRVLACGQNGPAREHQRLRELQKTCRLSRVLRLAVLGRRPRATFW